MSDSTGDKSACCGLPLAVLRGVILVLAVGGLLITGILLARTYGATGLPGCGADSGCDAVLNSRWSKVYGLPVAALAILVYAVVFAGGALVSSSAPPRRRSIGWSVLLAAACLLVLAGAYFIAIQLWKIGSVCPYCMAAHGVGLVTAVAIAAAARAARTPGDGSRASGFGRAAAAVAGAVALIGGLAAVQFTQAAPTVLVEDADSGLLDLLGGAVSVDPHRTPRIGPADAPVQAVEMFDYTCPHCRKMSGRLVEVKKRYGDQLAILLLPIPLNSNCNKHIKKTNKRHTHACALARVAHAVWLVNPEQFESYHEWVFEPAVSPEGWVAREHAEILVGKAALAEALEDPWCRQQIEDNVDLYETAGKGALPKLIFADHKMSGVPELEALYTVLEVKTSLRPPRK